MSDAVCWFIVDVRLWAAVSMHAIILHEDRKLFVGNQPGGISEAFAERRAVA